jgi:hypothetical protein
VAGTTMSETGHADRAKCYDFYISLLWKQHRFYMSK